MNQIIILTGPVHSGKTSFLQQWIPQQINVAGILTPVINGERFFYSIATADSFPMNASPEEEQTLTVGRFNFSETNFKRASSILQKACDDPSWNYLVIDEIGPLELIQQKGFYGAIMYILKNLNRNCHLILVVRENCVSNMLKLLNEQGHEVAIWPLSEAKKKSF